MNDIFLYNNEYNFLGARQNVLTFCVSRIYDVLTPIDCVKTISIIYMYIYVGMVAHKLNFKGGGGQTETKFPNTR